MLIEPIRELLAERLGQPILYPSDCEYLRNDIFRHTKIFVGTTTIKRILGFVNPHCNYRPRRFTLDVIAHYLGFADYQTLLVSLDPDAPKLSESSRPFIIESRSLRTGSIVSVAWQGGSIRFEAIGNECFRVIDVSDRKLVDAEIYSVKAFRCGMPLYLRSTVTSQCVKILAGLGGICSLRLE